MLLAPTFYTKVMQVTSNLSCIIIALIISWSDVTAQQTARKADNGTGYLEYLPPGYNDNSSLYPTIIFLHGSGERGDGSPAQLERVKTQAIPKNIENGHNMCFEVNGIEECFLVFSPQTSRWTWMYDVLPLMDYLKDNYRIDPDRIYITGLSMGGEGTWVSLYNSANVPNIFAAAAPVAARGGYNEACVVAQESIPVWAFHGDADTAIKLFYGERPIRGMNDCGADPAPIFTVYPGVGHAGTWNRAYRTDNSLHTPNLYQWFLSQRKGTPAQKPPVVNAANNITITLPANTAQISATASDPDGTIASIQWTQNSGPNTATVSDLNQLNVNLSDLVQGTYTFTIEVIDNDGLSASDNISVIVNPEPPNNPPTADAGGSVTITLPQNSIVATGNGMDNDGTISAYLWQQNTGPGTATILNPALATTSIEDLVEGTYSFTFIVTDNDGDTGIDNLSVIVNPEPVNDPPTANAGVDIQITLPVNSVTVNGTGADSDGSVQSYSWNQSSGPSSATIASPAEANSDITGLIQGTYLFTLTVMDDDGDTGTDQIVVNVLPPPPNSPPNANAGDDIIITLPVNNVELQGTGTDEDGTVAHYQWVRYSGPNNPDIADPGLAITEVNNLMEGVYIFTLTVTDNGGADNSDNVLVTVFPEPANNPPAVDAGEDIAITLPENSTSVTATVSDTDGTIFSYEWVQDSGPGTATITAPTSASTELSDLIEGIYQFSISAKDDDGAEGIDNITITVFPEQNKPPVASAGADREITLPSNNATLTGSGADDDGTVIEYLWEQINGPSQSNIAAPSMSSSLVSGLVEGIYTFQLTIKDDDGATDTDQVILRVYPEPVNLPPVADAGDDIFLTLPVNSTTLTGNGIDSDGTIVSYLWQVVDGNFATVSDLDQQVLNVSDLVEGVYIFSLTVEDDKGATGTDEVRVSVNSTNSFPTSIAGPDMDITLPTNSVVVNGSATDNDGSIILTLWEQVSGPAAANIMNPTSLQTTVSNLVEGTYTFSLLVQDDEGATDADEIIITVKPEPLNNSPAASAGADRSLILPVNSIVFNGTGSDTDGVIVAYQWSQSSGPNTATSSATTAKDITYSGLVEGVYRFRLTVTDDDGAKGVDEVNVTVLPDPGNQLPSVTAGENISIVLPQSTVNVSGSATDTDGTISSFLWSQMAGPLPANIVSQSSASTEVNGLSEGVYTFRLTVTDNEGGSSFDQIDVIVKPDPANIPPIVEAGSNRIMRIPQSTVTFNASAEDMDGSITDVLWTQVNGPTTATLSGEGSLALTADDIVLGTYIFRITVTDDEGGVNFDEVNVIVMEALSNQPPIVNAEENILLFDPDNSTQIGASATDSDGNIVSQVWSQVSGPSTADISNASAFTTEVNNLTIGTYIFRIEATDNGGLTGFDQISVRVNQANANTPPDVNAGSDISITLPVNTTTVTAVANDQDGIIDQVVWTQQSGPNTVVLSAEENLQTDINGLLAGIYVFRITVTDNRGASDFDEVQVAVNPAIPNNPPIVNAGADRNEVLPLSSVMLSGTATDTDGAVVEIEWTQQSGPSAAMLLNPSQMTTEVSGLTEGTYIFRLSATDDDGAVNFDQVTFFVTENEAPSAFAGDDVQLIFPVSNITITGSGIDNDGTIVEVLWKQTNGITATTSSTDQYAIDISDLIVGVYEFSFTVTDDKGASATDIVQIEVIPNGSNQMPLANAGEDEKIYLPENSIILRGSGTDPDGEIIDYLWEKINGAEANITDPSQAEVTITDLQEGTYIFQLTVTDDGGLSAKDDITIKVAPAIIEEFFVPRFITPNGDGENDVWVISGIERGNHCSVKIYSSTGFKVYESENYNNTWDGTYDGAALDQGAYYYTLICGNINRSGGIRLIR